MKKIAKLSFLILLPLLLVVACSAEQSSGADPTALPYTPMAFETKGQSEAIVGRPEQGMVVFQENCTICHSINDGENGAGPTLFAAGQRLDYDYVKESIILPQEHIAAFEEGQDSIEATIMPTSFEQTLSTQELEDLVMYLLSLQ